MHEPHHLQYILVSTSFLPLHLQEDSVGSLFDSDVDSEPGDEMGLEGECRVG